MFSMPPAMATSTWPSQISCAAVAIACAPEPQTRLTVIAGTATGTPPLSAACRAGFMRLPAWMTLPITTADARGIEPRAPQRFANHRATELGRRSRFQRTVVSSDRGANGVTQNDLSRLHASLLRSMLLSVHGSQIPLDAPYRGVSRFRGHGETHA